MSTHADPLYLGIDGGGSKTLAVIVDAQGNERGRGSAAGANHHAAGLPHALAQIELAVHHALAAVGGELPLAGAWVGLAGIDDPTDQALLLPHLRALSHHLRLTNDAELLLGALPGALGVALIAGTGAIALGCDAQGQRARANGWGHLIGDEGSGYAIGQAALRAVTRAADGRGPATALCAVVLAAWNLADPAALIPHVYADPDKVVIARLAPLVLAAWRAGDAVAGRIVRHAAADLAASALAVGRALTLPAPLPLACGGALLTQADDYRKLVATRLCQTRPIAPVVVPDPAHAAARAMISLSEEPHP